ncbi:unnamed protein product [Chrysoparadoxa australica]
MIIDRTVCLTLDTDFCKYASHSQLPLAAVVYCLCSCICCLCYVILGKIYQEVSDDGTEIINTIQLRPSFTPMLFGDTASEIKITLKAEVAGRKKMKRRLQKVEVKPVAVGGVDTSFLPPIGLLLPSFLPQPRGGFTTTYVDSKLWVLSTGKNLFIHTRAQGLNT